MEYVAFVQNVYLVTVQFFIIGVFITDHYSVNEGLFSFYISAVTGGFFLIELYYLVSKENVFYSFVMKVAVTLFYSLFAYFNPWFFIFISINVLAAISQVLKTTDKRRFFTRYLIVRKTEAYGYGVFLGPVSRSGRIMPFVLIGLALTFPLYWQGIQTWPSQVTVPAGNEAPKMEISWTWANGAVVNGNIVYGTINDSVLQALNYTNHLSHIRVSVDIPLPEEFMVNTTLSKLVNGTIANLTRYGIIVDIAPMLPFTNGVQYITDYTMDQFVSVYKTFKQWIQNYSLTNKFRFLLLDIESWGLGAAVHNWWNESIHDHANQDMQWLFNDMHNNTVRNFTVAGTSFAPHLTEFLTPDNAEQKLFKMCLFPYNWQYFGWMAYETGPGAAQAVYGYSHAIKDFFGDKGLTAIISADTLANILLKLRIIKNLGFNATAVWALSAPKNSGGFLETYNLTQFKWLMDQINENGVNAAFSYNSLQYVWLNSMLCWVKLNLWQPWTRWGSPIQ